MKKSLLVLLAASFTTLGAQEAAQGINFEHGTWKEILAKAKKEKKLIMLDAYASWCGPCKWMAKSVFTLPAVGEFYNKNFINAKIDMEKGEGVELSKKYGVTAYPTFFYIDGNGNMVHRKCGGQEGEDFIQAGKDAMDPAKQLSVLQKKFEKDSRNAELALQYFEEAEKACVALEEPVKKYLAGLKPETYTEKTTYALIDKFVEDPKEKSFIYLLDNYEKAAAAIGKADLDRKIESVYAGSIFSACRNNDESKLNAIQKDYRSRKLDAARYLDAYSKMTWAEQKQDTATRLLATIELVDGFFKDDGNALNHYAWEVYELTSNKEQLQKAAQWAQRSVELSPGYENTDTYGALLFKLGQYENAKAWLTRSIQYAKSRNIDAKSTEQLLEETTKKLSN